MSIPVEAALEVVGLDVGLEVVGRIPFRAPLNSSAIATATYTEADELLVLVMHDGTVIEYYDVPLSTFTGLITAASPGSYYNRYIRRGFRNLLRP